MITVVCFDLDDTLCDETTSDRVARKKVFSYIATNYHDINLSTFQTTYHQIWEGINENYIPFILQLGIGERDLRRTHANRVLQTLGITDPTLAEKLTYLYWEERRKALKLFPDARPVLSFLQKNYPLSLLANGPSDYQRQKINDLQIAEYFEHIIIAGEVGYAKPDTKIFDILMSHYTAPPSQILYVGNSQKRDVIGAHNARLQVAWVNRTGEKRKPETPIPDYEIKNLRELLNII